MFGVAVTWEITEVPNMSEKGPGVVSGVRAPKWLKKSTGTCLGCETCQKNGPGCFPDILLDIFGARTPDTIFSISLDTKVAGREGCGDDGFFGGLSFSPPTGALQG